MKESSANMCPTSYAIIDIIVIVRAEEGERNAENFVSRNWMMNPNSELRRFLEEERKGKERSVFYKLPDDW